MVFNTVDFSCDASFVSSVLSDDSTRGFPDEALCENRDTTTWKMLLAIIGQQQRRIGIQMEALDALHTEFDEGFADRAFCLAALQAVHETELAETVASHWDLMDRHEDEVAMLKDMHETELANKDASLVREKARHEKELAKCMSEFKSTPPIKEGCLMQ